MKADASFNGNKVDYDFYPNQQSIDSIIKKINIVRWVSGYYHISNLK